MSQTIATKTEAPSPDGQATDQPRPKLVAPVRRPHARTNKADLAFKWLTALSAFCIVLLMLAIGWELLANSMPSIRNFGLSFLFSRDWNPVTDTYGAASSIYGTVVTTIIALSLAVPLSMVIALFLVELAPPAVSRIVGGGIELLAAIPSIIYGMWGMFVFVPYMREHVQPWLGKYFGFLPLFSGPPMGLGMLTAGIILALMILPFIAAIMRDVLHMVPPVVKEAAYGMGATTWEVTRKVSLPYGLRGMAGAIFLGLGRALGETMAVTFVIGNSTDLPGSLFGTGNTIASMLAAKFAEAGDMHRSALIELALVLFVVTFAFQALAYFWLGRMARKIGASA